MDDARALPGLSPPSNQGQTDGFVDKVDPLQAQKTVGCGELSALILCLKRLRQACGDGGGDVRACLTARNI